MHKRPKLPNLGSQGQSPSHASSSSTGGQRGAEEETARTPQNTTSSTSGQQQGNEGRHHALHNRSSHSTHHENKRYHSEENTVGSLSLRHAPLNRSSTRPLQQPLKGEMEERGHDQHDERDFWHRARGAQRALTLPGSTEEDERRLVPRGVVAPPSSSSFGTSSVLATAGAQAATPLMSKDLQPREIQVLPSVSVAPRAKASAVDECCRQTSPVRSTAPPSSVAGSSRRSSSSTATSYADPQHHLVCPVPPPEDTVPLSIPAPARSRALGESRTGSRTPDPTSRTVSGRTTPERTSSRCLTPEPHCTVPGQSMQPMPQSLVAHEGASRDLHRLEALPISRCGWSVSSEIDRERCRSPSSPTSPYRLKDVSSSPGHRGHPLPPLQKYSKGSAVDSDPSTPTSPNSERRRRPHRAPTGESIRSSSLGHGGTEQHSDRPLRKKGSGPLSDFGMRGEEVVGANSSLDSPAVVTLMPTRAESSQNASSSSINRSSVLNQAKNRLRPTTMRNPRQQLRNGSRDDSFLSTISESTRSSDSTSTEEKKSRDSKITVLDGSQIEVFSESPQGEAKTQVDVLKDFRQLFEREDDAIAEQMQQYLRQNGFDKPLEMQRRVMPLVSSAFRDEQKSFITVQGAVQCGKTSALVLGILGAVSAEMGGIRAVVLSTSSTRDFKKYYDICSEVHPIKLECFEGINRRVSFEGLPPDPDSALAGVDPLEDLQRLSSALGTGAPAMVFGHPSRVLPLFREAPSWGVDLSNVQVLALDDAEETICMGLMDEVCEVCTILRHFSKHRLRHIILSHFLSHEAKSMIRCLRNSLLRQQNLFGIRAHRTQARAKCVNHYYAVAPRPRWPAMLAALHHALSLPSGIIFDDASPEARAQVRQALRSQGVTASVWNALQEQGSGARAAARDGASAAPRGPAFHLMPSDLVVLKVDLPQVRCVLHFEVPRRELSVYGLRLMCLEQQDQKKISSRKGGPGGKSLSVLFVEEEEVVRELEKTFHIQMQEVPTEMLAT